MVHFTSHTDGHPSQAQGVLDRCASTLAEYRAHKAALGAWLREFAAQHGGQRPGLLDAQARARATCDPALVGRFEQYLAARKRLMAEIPLLRKEYEAAAQADDRGAWRDRRRGAGAAAGVPGANANLSAARSPSQAAHQWAAAIEYRRSHSPVQHALEGPGAGAPVAATPSAAADAAGVAGAAAVSQLGAAEAEGNGASSSPPALQILAVVSPSAGRVLQSQQAQAADDQLGRLKEKAAAGGGAPASRMRSAALAALQYKQRGGGGAAHRSGAVSAVLQAPVPPPPEAGQPAVIAEVETAKFDVYRGRNTRALDEDVRLDVVLDNCSSDSLTAAPPMTAARCAPAGGAQTDGGAPHPGGRRDHSEARLAATEPAAAAAETVQQPSAVRQQRPSNSNVGGSDEALPPALSIPQDAVPLPT